MRGRESGLFCALKLSRARPFSNTLRADKIFSFIF